MVMDKRIMKKILLNLGRVRIAQARAHLEYKYSDPFESCLYVAFQASNLGSKFADWKLADLKYRAEQAKTSVSSYVLNRRDKLSDLLRDIRADHRNIESAINGLIKLDLKYDLHLKRDLSDIDPEEFLQDLKKVKGLGDWLTFYLICELNRLWGLRIPKGLKLPEKYRQLLMRLGLSEEDFHLSEYPYLDMALWDVSS
ncbi:hypothetical protein DRO64_02975 [Candidatus Bathyarchaeota archaeon]|nr:MAG: hypothetical protein DRO64_02975 [Candidatus Bathyarchaeota archaeon]